MKKPRDTVKLRSGCIRRRGEGRQLLVWNSETESYAPENHRLPCSSKPKQQVHLISSELSFKESEGPNVLESNMFNLQGKQH
jgi:hypothetical protein